MIQESGGSAVMSPSEAQLTFEQQVAGVAGYVANLPRGDRAELRRVRTEDSYVPPEVFWRIVDRYEIRERDETFWLAVLPAMVRHPHKPGEKPGRVFAAADVKKNRVERWLRHDRNGALAELERLLSLVDGPVDWVHLGKLLYWWDHPLHGDWRRRELARDYFLSPSRREQPQTEGDH